MKYYIFHGSIDNKVVGKYPQSEEVKVYGNLHELPLNQPIKEDKLIMQEPILLKKAKLTSYLDITAILRNRYMVINDNLMNFLAKFAISEYTKWPIKIHQADNVISNYKLFHISYPSDEMIVDYKNSEFLVGKLGDWRDPSIRKPVKVDSYAGYLNLRNELRNRSDNSEIRCNKLIIDFTKTDFDLLRLANVPFGARYYISEKLKDAIEKEGFTGFDFKEIEYDNKNIYPIWE